MSLALTADSLRACYDFLCETPPFCRWHLPPGEEIKFRVTRSRQHHGQFWPGQNAIDVSSHFIQRTQSLIELMAHEMIHLHEDRTGCGTKGQHSAAFRKWAEQVCRVHGFDLATFI